MHGGGRSRVAGARSWKECARGWKKNRWRSGIGRFRTEVLGRERPEGAATEHTECGIKGRAWIPGRGWAGSDSKLGSKIGSGLMVLLVPVRPVFVDGYAKWQARRALAGCLH